jgi:hypothetical protein
MLFGNVAASPRCFRVLLSFHLLLKSPCGGAALSHLFCGDEDETCDKLRVKRSSSFLKVCETIIASFRELRLPS